MPWTPTRRYLSASTKRSTRPANGPADEAHHGIVGAPEVPARGFRLAARRRMDLLCATRPANATMAVSGGVDSTTVTEEAQSASGLVIGVAAMILTVGHFAF